MNRRSFLKAIATIGAVAAIPAALVPTWKRNEPTTLTFKGAKLVYDEHCLNSRIYFLSKDGPYVLNTATWEHLKM